MARTAIGYDPNLVVLRGARSVLRLWRQAWTAASEGLTFVSHNLYYVNYTLT